MRDLTKSEIVSLLDQLKNSGENGVSIDKVQEVINQIQTGTEVAAHPDELYLELGQKILDRGTVKGDRTGTGTISITGDQLRFDNSDKFPALTTKQLAVKATFVETLWFIKGMTSIRYLLQHNVNIWNEWPFKKWVESEEYKKSGRPDMSNFGQRVLEDEEFKKEYKIQMDYFKKMVLEDDEFDAKFGDLGRVYGAQWRDAYYVNPDTKEVKKIDPLKEAIQQIKEDPNSRRIIVSSWNPDNHKGHAGLPCCHHQYQFVVNEGKLDIVFDMRSSDYFLGLPFNIAGYALLNRLVAKETGYQPGDVVYQGKDIHIYSNHVEQVKEQLTRTPKELPTIWLNPEKSMFDFEIEDIKLVDYDCHPAIKAPVSV